MRTLFEDDFLYKKLFKRIKKDIKLNELDKTIKEISYFNELQSHVISRCDFMSSKNQELEFIKNLNNARIQNV